MKWCETDRSMTFGKELVECDSNGFIHLFYTVEVIGNTQTRYGINQIIKNINNGIKKLETEKAQLRAMKKSYER